MWDGIYTHTSQKGIPTFSVWTNARHIPRFLSLVVFRSNIWWLKWHRLRQFTRFHTGATKSSIQLFFPHMQYFASTPLNKLWCVTCVTALTSFTSKSVSSTTLGSSSCSQTSLKSWLSAETAANVFTLWVCVCVSSRHDVVLGTHTVTQTTRDFFVTMITSQPCKTQ